jgi:NADPH-dependent glutamate synthase beta subunit-like oxidoreductase
VNIHAVERFLGDRALQEQWAFPPPLSPQRSQKVLVVGAGPSGLSAAYHLARRGYQVTICERREEAGGLLRYGIPPYRLPKDIVRAEIQRLLSVGMALRLNTEVSSLEEVQHEFAACYLALGAGRARTVPGLEEARIIDALDFLRHVETFPRFSGFVAVYGGGNTAFDAARTAIRLGATRVVVLYRGAQERLSAHPEEITLAQQEGVEILPLRMITEFSDEGKLTLEVREPVEAGKTKSSGRTEHLSVERLILAIGQEVEAEGFSKLARQEGGGG